MTIFWRQITCIIHHNFLGLNVETPFKGCHDKIICNPRRITLSYERKINWSVIDVSGLALLARSEGSVSVFESWGWGSCYCQSSPCPGDTEAPNTMADGEAWYNVVTNWTFSKQKRRRKRLSRAVSLTVVMSRTAFKHSLTPSSWRPRSLRSPSRGPGQPGDRRRSGKMTREKNFQRRSEISWT